MTESLSSPFTVRRIDVDVVASTSSPPVPSPRRAVDTYHSPHYSKYLLEFSSMETFRLLSRGGVKFNKKRFKTDMDLFEVRYDHCHRNSCLTVGVFYSIKVIYNEFLLENCNDRLLTNYSSC